MDNMIRTCCETIIVAHRNVDAWVTLQNLEQPIFTTIFGGYDIPYNMDIISRSMLGLLRYAHSNQKFYGECLQDLSNIYFFNENEPMFGLKDSNLQKWEGYNYRRLADDYYFLGIGFEAIIHKFKIPTNSILLDFLVRLRNIYSISHPDRSVQKSIQFVSTHPVTWTVSQFVDFSLQSQEMVRDVLFKNKVDSNFKNPNWHTSFTIDLKKIWLDGNYDEYGSSIIRYLRDCVAHLNQKSIILPNPNTVKTWLYSTHPDFILFVWAELNRKDNYNTNSFVEMELEHVTKPSEHGYEMIRDAKITRGVREMEEQKSEVAREKRMENL